jgi:hypothetical protein
MATAAQIRVYEGQLFEPGATLLAKFSNHQEVSVRFALNTDPIRLRDLNEVYPKQSSAQAIDLASRAASRAWHSDSIDAEGRILVRYQDLFPEL